MEHRRPRISIIAAIGTRTRALGRGNDLIWRISNDLKRFKKITDGHPIIMGNKTYESIGRVLPGRKNIILSRNVYREIPGATVVRSVDNAIRVAGESGTDEIFIIGGGQVFQSTLHIADRIYLTLIDDDTDGDVHFPDYSEFRKKIDEERHDNATPPYRFVVLERGD